MKETNIILLENNLRVLFINNTDLSCVSLWLPAGSRYDGDGLEGTAHLCEHLLMVKTVEYKEQYDRTRVIEKYGIKYNATVNRDLAVFYQIQPLVNTEQSLKYLIDGHLNSIFSESDLSDQKITVANECSMNLNNSYDYLWHQFFENHLGSDFGRSLFGDQISINRISSDHVRTFIEKQYKTSPLIIVNGNVDRGSIIKLISEQYGDVNFSVLNSEKENLGIKRNSFNIETEDKAGMFFSTNKILNTKQAAALDVLSYYLGNTWSSLLLKRLRIEKPLAYWVSAESGFIKGLSYLGILFDTDKAKAELCRKIITNELEKIKNGEIDVNILIAAKNIYTTELTRRLGDCYELSWWYGSQYFSEAEVVDPEEYIKNISVVTGGDIIEIALNLI